MSTSLLVLQDKVNKEVNFILANQETIQSQITQLEATNKQMEVTPFPIIVKPFSLCWCKSIPKRL